MIQSILGIGIWLIPVVAICVWGIMEIVKMVLAHQERLALIERGIYPDSVKKDQPT
jgi:hypothetical protein